MKVNVYVNDCIIPDHTFDAFETALDFCLLNGARHGWETWEITDSKGQIRLAACKDNRLFVYGQEENTNS